MNLGSLNNTIILIDTEFFNEIISYYLTLYQRLYPDKDLKKINLTDLIYKLAINARVEEAGHKIDVIFAYTFSNSRLLYCKPADLTYDISNEGIQKVTDKGTFLIRAFFADEDETCSEHFLNLLQIINHNPNVSRIVLFANNSDYNNELEMIIKQKEKSLFLFRQSGSGISLPIKNINLDLIIPFEFGLTRYEI